jgi:hypothetical protein
MTIKEAMKARPEEAERSMFNELKGIHDKGTFIPVRVADLSAEEARRILPSKLFLKEKFSPMKVYEKLKSRLVGGGHRQDRTLYEDHERSSPTLSTTALFTIAGIAAQKQWKKAVCDVGSAYLNASLGDKHVIHMRLHPMVAEVLCKVDEKYNDYRNADGSIVVRLVKALYGLVESALLWYRELTSTLLQLGYEVNPFEKCVFVKKLQEKVVSIVGVFVDDLKIIAEDEKMIDDVHNALVMKYKEVKITKGDLLEYLGMVWDYRTPYEVSVSMPKYVEELLESSPEMDHHKTAKTPAANDLLKIGDSELLKFQDKIIFHSETAKLLYLAKRIKPELLLSVSFLASRVQSPTTRDFEKLNRVFQYIRRVKHVPLRMKFTPGMVIGHYDMYIDASHGTHDDMRGQSGVCMMYGGACILGKSMKQKITTKSSAETELVALSDHAGLAIHGQRFLQSLGHVGECIIFQDNTSTKEMISNVNVNDRSKHIRQRYYWLKERIMKGEVQIHYLPTEKMIADVFTKPLQGDAFCKFRDLLVNRSTTNVQKKRMAPVRAKPGFEK